MAMSLKDLKKIKKLWCTVEAMKSWLRYERHQGCHTYHHCSCPERNITRSGLCGDCAENILHELEAKQHAREQRKRQKAESSNRSVPVDGMQEVPERSID